MHHPVFSPVVPLCLLDNCLDNLVDLCRVQMVKLLVSRLGNDNANLNIIAFQQQSSVIMRCILNKMRIPQETQKTQIEKNYFQRFFDIDVPDS